MNYQFKPRWIYTVIAWSAIVLTLSLSQWQLERGKQKASLNVGLESAYAAQPKPLSTHHLMEPVNFLPVEVTGTFRNGNSILLDNQMYQGIAGYHVLTPLDTRVGVVLVNRGWIPRGNDRSVLPAIPLIHEPVQFTAYLYQPGKAFTLTDDLWNGVWPMRLQALDYGTISDAIGVQLPPLTLRVKPDQIIENGEQFVRDWHHRLIPPGKHYAYALQWFTMAAVILMLWVGLNIKKVRDE